MLKNFANDPSVRLTEDKEWVKDKVYHVDEDIFEYSFLVGEGRDNIKIVIYDVETSMIIANFEINTHIHFKETQNG